MKLIISLFLSVICLTNLYATRQANDILLYNKKVSSLINLPLEKYYEKEYNSREDLFNGKFSGYSNTGCRRGYIGIWSIEYDRLYLIDLLSCNASSDSYKINYKVRQQIRQYLPKEIYKKLLKISGIEFTTSDFHRECKSLFTEKEFATYYGFINLLSGTNIVRSDLKEHFYSYYEYDKVFAEWFTGKIEFMEGEAEIENGIVTSINERKVEEKNKKENTNITGIPITGKYEAPWVSPHYLSIELKEDSTFEMIDAGDLYPERITRGSWTVNKDTITINSFLQLNPIIEFDYENKDSMQIIFFDNQGKHPHYLDIYIKYEDDSEILNIFDTTGTITVPYKNSQIDEISIYTISRMFGNVYSPHRILKNGLKIVTTNTNESSVIKNGNYLFRGDTLYTIAQNDIDLYKKVFMPMPFIRDDIIEDCLYPFSSIIKYIHGHNIGIEDSLIVAEYLNKIETMLILLERIQVEKSYLYDKSGALEDIIDSIVGYHFKIYEMETEDSQLNPQAIEYIKSKMKNYDNDIDRLKAYIKLKGID